MEREGNLEGLVSPKRVKTRKEFLSDIRTALKALVVTKLVPSQPPKEQIIKRKPVEKPKVKEVLRQSNLPNDHVTLSYLSKVPEYLFHHTNTEPVSVVLNFIDRYKKDLPDHYFKGKPESEGGDKEFWEGVSEAVDRGQRVYMTVELPGEKELDAPVEEWEKYVTAIAATYPGARLIIGNEINIDGNRYKDNPELYVKYYVAAAKAIRQTAPESKVLIYGEAHNEDGQTLKNVLEILFNPEKTPDINAAEMIDGILFHFYDVAGKLPARVEMYHQIAEKYSLPLFLTELGKAEHVELKGVEHVNVVGQNMAVALALMQLGLIGEVVWHTAYLLDDPNHHSLTITNEKGKVIDLKPAFGALWVVSKLLHHDVKMEIQENLTMVTGKTSDDDDTMIFWNNENYVPISRRGLWSWMRSKLVPDDDSRQTQVITLPTGEKKTVILPRSTTEGVEGRIYVWSSAG